MLQTCKVIQRKNRLVPLSYREFRRFMLDSNKLWKQRYPKFRSNYQGDKLIGYSLVKDYVRIPDQYHFLPDIYRLTPNMIRDLGDKPFVIKATLGHQGNKVLCFESKKGKGISYCDRLRSQKQRLTVDQLVSYATRKLGKPSKKQKVLSEVIIEEYVGDPDKGIPIDYKVYTVLGKAKVINLYIRGPNGKFMACFDKDWNRIPLDRFYVKPKELGYIESRDIKLTLPPTEKRNELIHAAEKLAEVHRAQFCRYDFYYENDCIYFGEITPVCGGIKNHHLTDYILNIFGS